MACCRSHDYHCTGHITDWTACQYKTLKPKRKAFKVPKEYHDVDFLKKYKYVARERVFPPKTDEVDSAASSSKGKLHNAKFVLLGKTAKSHADLTAAIEALGGSVVKKVDSTTLACISTISEYIISSTGYCQFSSLNTMLII